jgi:hypothetical protein
MSPGSALVGHFHSQMAAAQLDADAEVTVGLSGSAVHGGVRDQLGQAEDGVGGGRAAVQYGGQELACLPHLRGGWPGRRATTRAMGRWWSRTCFLPICDDSMSDSRFLVVILIRPV